MRNVVFVIKDIFTTKFMQACDVYEKFKFQGRVLETVQEDSHAHLSAKEIFERIKHSDDKFQVVGVIIPGDKAYFLPNHAVISMVQDGELGWLTVGDLALCYRADIMT